MKAGIYQILNKINNKRYIGSSSYARHRISKHKSQLNHNIHINCHLQKSYNKHGLDNFSFEILEHCEVEKLTEREQYHIDLYDFKTLYNIRKFAFSGRGFRLSDEHKAKLLESTIKRCANMSLEQKKQFGQLGKGRPSLKKGMKISEWMSKEGIENSSKTRFKKGERKYPQSSFQKGQKAWNEGTKGIMKPNKTSFKKGESVSVKTQFKKGQTPSNIAYFSFVSPGGVLHTGTGLAQFANKVKVSKSSLWKLRNGEKESISGWRLPASHETKIIDTY